MNLLGGWVFTGLVMLGFPDLRHAAVEVATHYAELGINLKSFAAGVVAGMVITLMTWMITTTDAVVGKLAAAASAGFLLAAAKMNHAIVLSLVMFAALHAGAPFGYLDWLGTAAWAALANMVGGMGLVTLVRIVQVGRAKVEEERRRGPGEARPDDDEENRHPSGLVLPDGVSTEGTQPVLEVEPQLAGGRPPPAPSAAAATWCGRARGGSCGRRGVPPAGPPAC